MRIFQLYKSTIQEDKKIQWSLRHCQALTVAVVLAMATIVPHTALGALSTLSSPTLYWTTTNIESSAKAASAVLGATIDSDGGEAISERGIVWNDCSVNANPLIDDSNVWPVAGGVGTFSDTVTLSGPPAQICFKGFATNPSGTAYSTVSDFWSEPDQAAAPGVVLPSGTNYFDLTVNYTKPANADGVLVVVRQNTTNSIAPYDGTVYNANPRIGAGDTTDPGCRFFCDYVVADATTSGSVIVTGLKEGYDHAFTVYSYKGSGTGISGINYVQTISTTVETTDTVPIEGTSHNELFVAADSTYDPSDGSGTPGTMVEADCANCHASHHESQHLPRGEAIYDYCETCHRPGGVAQNKSNIGLHLSDGRVDCGTCHSMHAFKTEELYSDATAHGGGWGFNLSFVRTNMSKYMNPADYPPPDGGGTVTALDNTIFQTRPDHFAFADGSPAYNGVCQSCHTTPQVNHHYQTGTDDHQIGNDCAACHGHKQAGKFDAFRAGHPLDFGSNSDCTGCHDITSGVMNGIHGDGTMATCTLCHNGTPNRDNEKLGDSIVVKSPVGDARLADGTAAANSWVSVTCTTCHGTTDADTNPMYFHGVTIPTVAQYHQLSSNQSLGYDCERCHSSDQANAQLTTHMGTDSVANCISKCHGNSTLSAVNSINAEQLILDVTFNWGEPNKNNTQCEECHVEKGDFKMHGMDDDASVADGIDNSNGPNGTTGLATHDNLGGANGVTVNYTGKLAGAYGGLKATTYNCGECHSGDLNTQTFTTLRAMQVHTINQGVGYGDCLTCHEFAGVQAIIDAGKGATGTTQNCEDCHAVAIGNGPSGEKMYQYDGVRHHKTARAQGGDCTYCHADPRPATPAQGAWGVYTAYGETADIVGTADTGFISDYSGITAPATWPEQMACRLCHTNYGETGNATAYAVNVRAEIDTNGNSNETSDHHRYPTFEMSAPSNGLTVYADDFNTPRATIPNWSNTLVRFTSDGQVIQSEIHRIEANDSSTMIKVENFGTCFACHTVQKRHAAPVPNSDYYPPGLTCSQSDAPYDNLRYAPGRSVFNDFRGSGNQNSAWNDHRFGTQSGMSGQPYDSLCDNQNMEDRGKGELKNIGANWNCGSITSSTMNVPTHASFNNYEGLSGMGNPYSIRYFTDIAPEVVDSINIILAEYTGSAIVVHATSSIGSGQTFTFTYTGGGCGTITMSWVTDHYEGTCNTPSGFTEGTDTVTVSNDSTTSPLDNRTRLVVDNSGPVVTVAVDDSFSVGTSTITLLDVLANDLGTNNTVVSTDDTLLNANCSTAVGGGGTRVDITCGATTGGMGTFDYVVQGDLNSDTGRVSITTVSNTPPTLSISQPNGDIDQPLSSPVDIIYSLADPDDVVTATFSLDTDTDSGNGTGSAITCTGGTGAGAEGTNVTCTWDASSIATGGQAYYVYGVTDDGINPPVEAYSGSITFASCTNASIKNAWTEIANYGSLASSSTNTIAYDVGAGSDRLLIVAITHRDNNANTQTWDVRYGTGGIAAGTTLTEIGSINGDNPNMWVGYLKETGIAGEGSTGQNIYFQPNNGAGGYTIDETRVHAIVLENVDQLSPIADFDVTAANGTNSISATALDWTAGDQVLYSAVCYNGDSHAPGAGYTEDVESSADRTHVTSAGHKTDTSADGTNQSITVTFDPGGENSGIVGVVVQSVCNAAAVQTVVIGSGAENNIGTGGTDGQAGGSIRIVDTGGQFVSAANGTISQIRANVRNAGPLRFFTCTMSGGVDGTCQVQSLVDVTATGTGLQTWSVSMAISQNDYIGFYNTTNEGIYFKTSTTNTLSYEFAGQPGIGTNINLTNWTNEVAIDATVEY